MEVLKNTMGQEEISETVIIYGHSVKDAFCFLAERLL